MLAGLGAQWNERLLQSWTWVYGVLSATMQSGAVASPAARQSKAPAALDETAQVQLVQASWDEVGKLDADAVAAMFYKRVHPMHPHMRARAHV